MTRILLLLILFLGAGPLSAQWVAECRSGDWMYFLRSDRIERYDVESGAWGDPVLLPRSGATAFLHDETMSAVAFGDDIYSYDSDFQSESFLKRATVPSGGAIIRMARDGELLIVVPSGLNGNIQSIHLPTLAVITHSYNLYHANSAVFDLAARRVSVFGEGRLLVISWNGPEDATPGSFVWPTPSIYYSNYAETDRLWLSDDGTRLILPAGEAVALPERAYLSMLPDEVRAAEFEGSQSVVAVTTGCHLMNSLFQPVGYAATPFTAKALQWHGDSVIAFHSAGTASPIEATVLPLDAFAYPEVPAPPPGIAGNFPPTTVLQDRNGILLFHKSGSSTISRWSPVTGDYLPGLSLRGSPQSLVYSGESNRVYSIYSDGTIRFIDAADGQETGFAGLEYKPDSVVACGARVLVMQDYERYLFAESGELTSFTKFNGFSIDGQWDPVRKRVYGGRLKAEALNDDGTSGAQLSSPDSANGAALVRVSQGGEWILSGNQVFSADGLGEAARVGRKGFDYAWKSGSTYVVNETRYVDAVWDGDERLIGYDSEGWIHEWRGLGFRDERSIEIPGDPVALRAFEGGFIAVSKSERSLHFTRISGELVAGETTPPLPVDVVSAFGITGRGMDSIDLEWSGLAPASSYRIRYAPEYPPGGVELSYYPNTDVVISGPEGAATLAGLVSNWNYRVQVQGLNVANQVQWSLTEYTRTLSDPADPMGAPYHLKAAATMGSVLVIEWDDFALGETEFRVTRTNSGGNTVVTSVPAGSTSVALQGLDYSTTYTVTIQAYRNGIAGDLSPRIYPRTAASDAPPGNFYFQGAKVLGEDGITMTFSNPSGEEGFRIERSLDTDPRDWAEIGSTGANVVTFTDSSAVIGNRYAYRAIAINRFGETTNYLGELEAILSPPRDEFFGISRTSFGKRFFSLRYPSRIEAFDFARRQWDEAIPTAEPARSIASDESGIVALEGVTATSLLPGGGRIELHANGARQDSLFLLDDRIFMVGYAPGSTGGQSTIVSSRGGGAAPQKVKSASNNYPYFNNPRFIEGTRTVFGIETISSPVRIGRMTFPADAADPPEYDVSHYSLYGSSGSFGVEPGGRWLLLHSGYLYDRDLVYQGGAVAPFDLLTFDQGGTFVVLRGNRLDCHLADFEPRGSLLLEEVPMAMDIEGSTLFLFYVSDLAERGLRVETVELDSLVEISRTLGPPVSPSPRWNLHSRVLTITNNVAGAVEAFRIRVSGLPEGVQLLNGVKDGSGYLLEVPAHWSLDEDLPVTLQFIGGSGAGFEPVISVVPVYERDAPAVPECRWQNGSVVFSFPSEAGKRYRVENSGALSGWTGSSLVLEAVGSVLEWREDGDAWDFGASGPRGFFRAALAE